MLPAQCRTPNCSLAAKRDPDAECHHDINRKLRPGGYLSLYPDAESDVALRLDRLAEGDARASPSWRRRLRYSLPEERPSPPVRPRSVAVRGTMARLVASESRCGRVVDYGLYPAGQTINVPTWPSDE